MPWAQTTSQSSGVLAAVGRTAVVVVLAVLLAGLLAGLVVPTPAQAVGGGSPEPTTAQGGSGEGTSPGHTRLGGAVTPRRYGLPTVLAVVLVLGVASLQVRLVLAEPAARRPERSTAPRPGRERRHGVGSPRW